MAQKTENEETEFTVVKEALAMCVNNCGVTGNPATNNMCQNCFSATTTTAAVTSSCKERSTAGTRSVKDPPVRSRKRADREAEEASEAKREVKRCSGCKRKVGLAGFRCRCGELFCWEHRYSDRHVCNFDYKAAGREAIARENPVVKAAKIVRV